MSEQLQLRGGPAAAINAIAGAPREVLVNTDQNRLTVHDGTTLGGFPVALLSEIPSGLVARSKLFNGSMSVDQRWDGASGTAIGPTVDGWQFHASFATKGTWGQNLGAITPPAPFVNYLGFLSNSSYTVGASDYFGFEQRIEGANFYDSGFGAVGPKTVTVSFWVYSSLTGTFGGTIQNFARTRSYPFTYGIAAPNTWTYVAIPILGDASGTWYTTLTAGMAILSLSMGAGSTYSGTAAVWAGSNYLSATGAVSVVGTSSAIFYVTGAKLEFGASASLYDFRDFSTQFLSCQRRWQRVGGVVAGDINLSGYAAASGAITTALRIPQMRATPTVTFVNGGSWTTTNVSSSGSFASPGVVTLYTVAAASAMVQLATTGTSTYLSLDADL